MSLLDRVRLCQRRDLAGFRRFRVAGRPVGWIAPPLAARLARFADRFTVTEASVDLADGLGDFAARSAAMAEVVAALAEEGAVPPLRGEPYPVATAFHAAPLLQIDRAAVPRFGIRAYGIHVNGFVGGGAEMRLWVGRRSQSKPTAPGKLDHIVAGGQPIGLGLRENLLKECREEADIPAALAGRAVPVGAVSYLMRNEEGIRSDVLFAYDLALPADFVPRNTDGEIDGFWLWPVAEVMRRIDETEDFKFNVALVVIDFLVRHGFLAPEHPDYLAILAGLRLPENTA